MALPHGKLARTFYRCAQERFEDADVLFADERNTGAVYLAGYAVECMLKALLLSRIPADEQEEMAATFRGNRAHDFDWILDQYYEQGGTRPPREINGCLGAMDEWSTELRYDPAQMIDAEAERFLESARKVVRWADGRM